MKYKIFIFLFLLSSLVMAQESPYRILFSESGKQEEISSRKIDGKEYISVYSLQKIFSLGQSLQPA